MYFKIDVKAGRAVMSCSAVQFKDIVLKESASSKYIMFSVYFSLARPSIPIDIMVNRNVGRNLLTKLVSCC